MDRYQMASIILVFPSPLFPEKQLMFGENSSSARAMFLKSWTTILSRSAMFMQR